MSRTPVETTKTAANAPAVVPCGRESGAAVPSAAGGIRDAPREVGFLVVGEAVAYVRGVELPSMS